VTKDIVNINSMHRFDELKEKSTELKNLLLDREAAKHPRQTQFPKEKAIQIYDSAPQMMNMLLKNGTKFDSEHVYTLLTKGHLQAVKDILHRNAYESTTDKLTNNKAPIFILLNKIYQFHGYVSKNFTVADMAEQGVLFDLVDILVGLIKSGDNINIVNSQFQTPVTFLTDAKNAVNGSNGLAKLLDIILTKVHTIEPDIYGDSALIYMLMHFPDKVTEENFKEVSKDIVEIDPVYNILHLFISNMSRFSGDNSIFLEMQNQFIKHLDQGYEIPQKMLDYLLNFSFVTEGGSDHEKQGLLKIILEHAKNQQKYFVDMILQHAKETGDYTNVAKLILQGNEELEEYAAECFRGTSLVINDDEMKSLLDIIISSEGIARFEISIQAVLSMNHNNWEYLFKLGQVLFKDVTNASNHTSELILCNIIAIQCQALAMWTSEADPMFVSHINSNGDAMYFKNALLYLAHGNHQDYFNKMSDLIQFFQTRAQDKEDKPYVREMYNDALPQGNCIKLKFINH